jgi:hypothetical protein
VPGVDDIKIMFFKKLTDFGNAKNQSGIGTIGSGGFHYINRNAQFFHLLKKGSFIGSTGNGHLKLIPIEALHQVVNHLATAGRVEIGDGVEDFFSFHFYLLIKTPMPYFRCFGSWMNSTYS